MLATTPRIAVSAALAVAFAGGAATAAEAYRGPTGHERSAITRAVKHARATSAFPDSAYRVTRIRVSTAGPYASGHVSGRVPPATVVLRRSHGRWKLKTIGTAELGCRLPSAVRSDLNLDCH